MTMIQFLKMNSVIFYLIVNRCIEKFLSMAFIQDLHHSGIVSVVDFIIDNTAGANKNIWSQTGKAMNMNDRTIVQRRGRLLKGA